MAIRKALTHQQVSNAVERKGGGPVPVFMGKWWGNGLREAHGPSLDKLSADYPDDICAGWYIQPGYDASETANPEYRFGFLDYHDAQRHSIGESAVLLPEWEQLDDFLAHFPDPNEPGNFEPVYAAAGQAEGRYKLGCWWRLFHERFWSIRGMENLMMDYYDNMEGLQVLGERLLAFYKVLVDRYAQAGYHGIFSSDDLGHQSGPMMSPSIFHELYFPLYKELADYIHAKGMHFWLHSCGDNTLLMDDLIAAGLDVFHPVQKGCMDFQATADRFGDRISFLAGFDVQNTIIHETPQGIRDEVRRMKAIFGWPDGGLLLAMGNGIMPGTPIENIAAALDEMYAEA